MRMRPVSLWSARVKDAVIMRISSYALPRRTTHFSDSTTLVCHSSVKLNKRTKTAIGCGWTHLRSVY